MKKNHKIIAGGTALLLALALGLAAVGTTSAYFSDTNTGGAITATSGSVAAISVDVNGDPTATPDIAFENLLPGATQEQSFTVTNSGTSPQDVWVQFPNPEEVGDFSDILKKDASFEIYVDGQPVWSSGTTADAKTPDWKLPEAILLAQDLAPGESVTVTFAMTLDATVTSADAHGTGSLPATLHYNIVATQPGIEPGV